MQIHTSGTIPAEKNANEGTMNECMIRKQIFFFDDIASVLAKRLRRMKICLELELVI